MIHDCQAEGLREAATLITGGMNWSDTPQGHEFWSDVTKYLENVAKHRDLSGEPPKKQAYRDATPDDFGKVAKFTGHGEDVEAEIGGVLVDSYGDLRFKPKTNSYYYHDCKIKCDEPDTKLKDWVMGFAPMWANWAAMDDNGKWFVYEHKPLFARNCKTWAVDSGAYANVGNFGDLADCPLPPVEPKPWEDSLIDLSDL